MDVSGEAADLVVKETVQVSEEALKFLGSGAKNLMAFLAAVYSQNNKVVGKTTAKRLARDPAPAEILPLKKEDIPKFQKLAKQYGVLYFLVHRDRPDCPITNVVSNSNYAPQLNAIMQELGYPIPQKEKDDTPAKKAIPRTQPERSSPERENGSKSRAGNLTPEKLSVRGRLATLQEASQAMEHPKVPITDKTR